MPRTGREPLPRELPDTGTTRRRARAGLGLVVAMLVLPFAVGALVRSGTTLGLVTGPLADDTALEAAEDVRQAGAPVRAGFRAGR